MNHMLFVVLLSQSSIHENGSNWDWGNQQGNLTITSEVNRVSVAMVSHDIPGNSTWKLQTEFLVRCFLFPWKWCSCDVQGLMWKTYCAPSLDYTSALNSWNRFVAGDSPGLGSWRATNHLSLLGKIKFVHRQGGTRKRFLGLHTCSDTTQQDTLGEATQQISHLGWSCRLYPTSWNKNIASDTTQIFRNWFNHAQKNWQQHVQSRSIKY